MVIDNTKLIRSLLWFPPKYYGNGMVMDEIEESQQEYRSKTGNSMCIDQRQCFYAVQLIQRIKDNPRKIFGNPNFRNNSNRTIQQFQIYSLEDWDLKIPTIIDLAKYYQARVYIDLNLKDSKDVFARLLKNMGERFATNNYFHLHRMFNEAVGQTPTMRGTPHRWVVDIDTKDVDIINKVKEFILNLRGGSKNRFETINGKKVFLGEIIAEVPTKNGVHLITTSFETNKFRMEFPGIDVHTANPTIAWMETDWKGDNGPDDGIEQ